VILPSNRHFVVVLTGIRMTGLQLGQGLGFTMCQMRPI